MLFKQCVFQLPVTFFETILGVAFFNYASRSIIARPLAVVFLPSNLME